MFDHQVAQELIDADRCSLFMVDRETNELFANTGALPSSTEAAAVSSTSASASSSLQPQQHQQQIRLPMRAGIIGAAATHAMPVLVPNVDLDPRFNAEVDLKTGYRTRSVICAPLLDENGQVGGAFVAESKASGPSSNRSLIHIHFFTAHCSSRLLA
jgi:GAF domain-containing protein